MQTYLYRGEHRKGPIKTSGQHSTFSNTSDLCLRIKKENKEAPSKQSEEGPPTQRRREVPQQRGRAEGRGSSAWREKNTQGELTQFTLYSMSSMDHWLVKEMGKKCIHSQIRIDSLAECDLYLHSHLGHLADAFNQQVKTIYLCWYSKDVHRTKCKALTIARLTHSLYKYKNIR